MGCIVCCYFLPIAVADANMQHFSPQVICLDFLFCGVFMTDNIVRFLRYHISVFIRQTVLMNNDIDIVVCIMASNLR